MQTELFMQEEHKSPAEPLTGDAQLTSHLNDPALRRQPLAEGEPAMGEDNELTGSAHSDLSPLASAGATPADEAARLARDAGAADERARRKGLAPRPEIDAWNKSEAALEKERQKDL